jgi:acyl-CoA synthetase (NDP forming)
MYQPSKPKSLQILSQGGIPVYPVVETAMRCMGSLVEYKSYLDRLEEEKKEALIGLPNDRMNRAKAIISEIRNSGRVNLVETEARELLKAYRFPMSEFRLARSEDEAIQMAEGLGYPVAMKIVSPEIIHKSDAGGVKLSIENRREVLRAFKEIASNARTYNRKAEIYGVMVTPMENKGVETIIGITKDQTFGPTVMFGVGGIFVEILKDVSFRVAPLTRNDAYEMIGQIRGFPILKGARGRKPVDIDALVDVVMKVSALVTENHEIAEVDLNPVFAFEQGSSVVDARIILDGF